MKDKETKMFKEECELQRMRNGSLREKLEKVTKEKDELLERLIDETKIRHGIRMTK